MQAEEKPSYIAEIETPAQQDNDQHTETLHHALAQEDHDAIDVISQQPGQQQAEDEAPLQVQVNRQLP